MNSFYICKGKLVTKSAIIISYKYLWEKKKSTLKKLKGLPPIKEHLLITRYEQKRVNKGEMLSVKDVEEILAIPLLGVIPDSLEILKASNSGVPVTLNKESDAGQAYLDVVARFLGEEPTQRKKKGFFRRWFGRKVWNL